MKSLVNHSIHDDGFWTWANAVTILRTVVSLILFSMAAVTHNEIFNYMGLGLFIVFDNLDGYLARALNQETLLGAQMDILSDRICFAFFYMNYLTIYPELTLVIVLFLVNFMVLDHYLSNQFMRWPIISPNYFYKVDQTIWRLNWSPLGKICNTGIVTILMITTKSVLVTLPVLIGLVSVKIYSCARLFRLSARLPEREGT
jgi:CDP-diacylglycerol--glycerol-3-phosphate 3-phosphatidyltransferase